MDSINNNQLRKIWAMSRELDFDSDKLHYEVNSITGKDSLKKLSNYEAKIVIKHLDILLNAEMITDGQLWKIRQLEKLLGWVDNPKRLKGFLKKYYNVESPIKLTQFKAMSAIESLKKLNINKRKKM